MKKNDELLRLYKNCRKKLIIMRNALIILLISTFQVVATSSYSQVTRLSLDMKGATVKEVLSKIEDDSEFYFLYNSELVDVNRKVNVSFENEKIETVLNQLFDTDKVELLFKDRHIIISPKENLSAQQQSISGKVTDESGEPLPGVTVFIKGTTNGTVTNVDGDYSLDAQNGDVVVFTFVGMLTQEVSYDTQSNIDVTMTIDTIGIEEVVAIGYGVQKKVNLTGAVGTVESSVLEAKPVTNVQELLQGKTPGLNITNGSGAPGSGASINIRGNSTIGGSSGVLVIIDGVPGNIYTVNPNDIESISVLKDAASASIYGSRAANGVILITTKRGSRDKELEVLVTSSIGVTNPLHFIDFVGGEDFMNLYNLARKNEGNDEFYTDQHFADLRSGKTPENVWYKEVFEKNQVISNNHVSLSGRTKKLEYNISGSYDYQSGALPKNDYNRYIFKPDITFNATKWLKVRANVQYTETDIVEPQGGSGNITAATRISPITPIYTSEGLHMGPGGTPGGNPIAAIEQGGMSSNLSKEMLSIFTATINPIKNWNIKPLFSIRNSERRTHNHSKPISLYNEDGSIYSQGPLSQQVISEEFRNNKTKLFQVTTDYSYSLKEKHNFNVLAGYSSEYNTYDGFGASRKGPAFADIFVLDIAQDAKDNWGTAYHDAMQSVFGRINYDFDGKYMLEANVRADGSSRFSKDYRWGTFPSFSGGWNVHREEFFQENVPFISRFKLRGSWGILGDALKINRYETRNLLSFNANSYGFDGSLAGGALSEASFKEDISWEKAKMTNIGADMGFWENHIGLTLEYFNNVRDDILYRAPVPAEYGLDAPFINALKMQNRGFEGIFSFKNKTRDFEYSVDFNFSYSKNKVLDLYGSGPWIQGSSFTDEGTQLGMLYGYENDGLYQSEEDISENATQVNVNPGNIKYKDQLTVDNNNDGIPDEADGIINGDDRVVLNDEVPVRFGFNINLKYKDFDFTVNTYGKLNNYRYIQGYEGWAFFLTTNARPMHLDSWTPDNKDASYPRITTNMTGNDREVSDYWLRKANYLKIQNIEFGYTLPNAFKNKIGIDHARVYLSGQNLGILSKYDGFDPEGGNYPLARTISLGLQLKF